MNTVAECFVETGGGGAAAAVHAGGEGALHSVLV